MVLRMRAVGLLIAVGAVAAACAGPLPGEQSSAVSVVAAENSWGSIAAQLGGSKVAVQSVVTDPNADPHEYETSTNDARAFADASLVILNGAGYDGWGQKLLDANPSSSRRVVVVAGLLGKKVGDDPHFWYAPAYVERVADAITVAYRTIDSADASYFDSRRADMSSSFQPYLDEIHTIRQTYAGTRVGSTETVFVYMASALGLDLTTPPEFMDAVSEGNDPPARAVVAFQDQVSTRQLKVLVYNVQTVTAVTTSIKDLAASRHIPTVGVSETLQPVNATFQQWQLAQLQKLVQALQANP